MEPNLTIIDEVLKANEAYAKRFTLANLPKPPARKLAVLACMDARLSVEQALGLKPGDAHILRNAGGVVTDDMIRSIAISQRKLGTTEIVLVHHPDCGMTGILRDPRGAGWIAVRQNRFR